jgi:hypothetical protein
MSVLEEVAALLASAGVGTSGTNLFVAYLPDAPTNAVVVYEYAGAPPTEVFSSTAHERPRIQVVSRSDVYLTARSKAKLAWDTLNAVANQTLSSTLYLRVRVLQSPFLMGRDENSNALVAFNAECMKVVS